MERILFINDTGTIEKPHTELTLTLTLCYT